MNVFDNEADFLKHYERARAIAEHPGNVIRADVGDGLLGYPALDETGIPHRDETGAILWLRLPVSGFAIDETGTWRPVKLLARELQSTHMHLDDTGVLSLRVTPEIRREREAGGSAVRRYRVLTIEVAMLHTIKVLEDLAAEFRGAALPLVAPWFPPEAAVEWEWSAMPPASGEPTRMIMRWRAVDR